MMKKFKIEVVLRGAGGTVTAPMTPDTLEAESLMEALKILAENANFPDNDLVKTIGVLLTEVEE